MLTVHQHAMALFLDLVSGDISLIHVFTWLTNGTVHEVCGNILWLSRSFIFEICLIKFFTGYQRTTDE
jgi:hypothetical protein